jgi:hypothetical protein
MEVDLTDKIYLLWHKKNNKLIKLLSNLSFY